MYPQNLTEIVEFFATLPEEERRENLILYAESARLHQPRAGESYVLEDARKDDECIDTVGIFLHVGPEGSARFRVALGPEVQTLTRAMTTILCKGLNGLTPREVLGVSPEFVPAIVGADLVRTRSRTVYYILGRMKRICEAYLEKSGAQERT